MKAAKYRGKTIHPYESFYWNTTQQFFRGELGGGIARCVKCDDSLATLVMEEEPKIINVGQWGNSQNTRVIDSSGISYAVTNGEKDGVPKIVEARAIGRERTEEEKLRRRLYGDKGAKFSQGKQMCLLGDITGCLTTIPTKDNLIATMIQQDNEPRYRIRKLTPKECFRLMDVDDADIDKIQAAGISNSQQYKMAGNSIVVACLYHLFRKMFTETHNEDRQLTLW